MKKSTLLSIPCLLVSTLLSAQQFEWAGQLGGNGWDAANKLAKDPAGSIYAAGTFNNSGDFDPGAGTFNLSSAGAQDAFLVKTTAAGNFRWALRFGGTAQDFGDAVATTPTADIYIGGKFRGTADFDPGAGNFPLTSAGNDDAYICKLDSAGNMLWAVSLGSTGLDDIRGMATDAAGNIYAIGIFSGTVDFDPGAGTSFLTATSGDMFIWKLNANGTFAWAQRYGSSPGENGTDLCIDAGGNIYATGSFYGTVDFDAGPGTFTMAAGSFYDDAFLLKLDASGNFLWAKKFGSSSGNDVSYALDVNAAGFPYITGTFNAAGDFDPGTGTYTMTPAGSEDVFVVKLTPAGDFVWATGIGDANFQAAYDLAIHPTGDVYVTGMFDGTVDFDAGAGSTILASAGVSDIFILQLDSNSAFRWAGRIGDTQSDFGSGIMALNGKLVVSGGFTQTADFDPGAGTYYLSSVLNTQDGFILDLCASYTVNQPAAICSGDSVYAAGAWQTLAGTYVDSLLSIYGCDSIIITQLTVNSPTVALGNDTAFCTGENMTIDAGNAGATYQWNTGATTQTITADSSGIYAVTITDAIGCTASDSISINVHALPTVTFAPLSTDTVCLSTPAFTLSGGAPSGGTYSGNGVSAGQFDPAVAGVGLHTLAYMYTDSNGCSASDSQTVFVDVCTEISESGNGEVRLFPNPSSGIVTLVLAADEQPAQVVLRNVAGQIVPVNVSRNKNVYQLDLQQMPAGIYFVEVVRNGSRTQMKIVRE